MAKIEPQFRDLAESLPHMVWTCEPDGPCDYLSPQWIAYTGIPEEPQLGYGWLARLHPDDVELTKQRWATATAAGGPFDTEFRIRRFDGVYRWFKTRAVPSRDESGKITKWFGTNTDIQELRDAQEAAARLNRELEQRVATRTNELRTANKQLQTVATQLQIAQRVANVGSWELDLATGHVSWSDELFRIFGMDRSQELPSVQGHAALFEPESWSRLSAAIEHSAATGEGYELILTACRADGSTTTAMARAQALRGASGTVERLVGTFQDISAHERTAQQLKQLSDRLQLATSAAKIGVWEWDLVAGSLFWDETMRQIYETPREREQKGYEDWHEAVHPEDLPRVDAGLAEALSGSGAYDLTFRIVCPSGKVKYVHAAATLERDAAGRVVRMTGVNWDITEQRIAELALADRTAQMEVLLQEIHHRVKNNLQVIASLVSMQARRVRDAASRDALMECRTRILAIALIHEQLYRSDDFSRIPFSDYAQQLARNVFAASGTAPDLVNLVLEVDEVALPVEKAIPCGLILNELITNALKHAFPGNRRGTVNVSLHAIERGELILSVSDDGVGVGDDFSLQAGGSLGMHLVSILSKQIDARIAIASNGGTQICVTIPYGGASTRWRESPLECSSSAG